MKTVHKFILGLNEHIRPAASIEVPKKAKFLKAAKQRNDICLWYEVDTDNELERKVFLVYMTGESLTGTLYCRGDYVDTILLDNDNFVVHIFEIKQP